MRWDWNIFKKNSTDLRKVVNGMLWTEEGDWQIKNINRLKGEISYEIKKQYLYSITIGHRNHITSNHTGNIRGHEIGLLSAITTTFPGGQIPNMIDKLLTSILLFLIIQFIRRFSMNTLAVGTISILGTLISGATFLLSALIIAGLPTSFSFLFKTVVLPTVLVNAALTIFIYHIIGQAMRVSGIQIE